MCGVGQRKMKKEVGKKHVFVEELMDLNNTFSLGNGEEGGF